ncbi:MULTISPECIES: hypothetical protein [Cryobacterium]|uniref:Uncharacterized protein n=1 Tax=Cryobacterium levicorallinum TaxID=995038 RepID=A0ABY1EBR5_9MICO|nr:MULTISPECIES: hypothetical protein [Cryobacterium]GEP25864.1 hypothetical protein CLE01_04620 [Cryobacterium levicorallinum]SFH38226.1 hypothetical protein SAMN05216274_104110 [Cryobacterium levicorallinum]
MPNFVSEIVTQTVQQNNWWLNGGGWFVLALVNAGLAEQKNRSRWNWFVLSLFLGPVATFFIVVWEPLTQPPLELRNPFEKADGRYLTLAIMSLVITVGLVLFAIAGQAWYVWVASAVSAAALVAFLVLFQRARSKRMLALRHANGA